MENSKTNPPHSWSVELTDNEGHSPGLKLEQNGTVIWLPLSKWFHLGFSQMTGSAPSKNDLVKTAREEAATWLEPTDHELRAKDLIEELCIWIEHLELVVSHLQSKDRK